MAEQDTTLTNKTGEELQQAVIQRQAEQADMTALPTSQQITPTPMQAQPGEEISPDVAKMAEVAPAVAAPAIDPTQFTQQPNTCLLYTSPSRRDGLLSRMPSSA